MTVNPSALQRVNNAVFYHLHKSDFHDDQWYAGNIINFDGKTLNPYYDFYSDYVPKFLGHPIPTPVALIEELKQRAVSLDFNLGELINLPVQLSEFIRELTACLREEIFEDVRKSQFPDRPSRKTCLYVCDELKVNDWKEQLSAPGVSLTTFRLSLTGTIFRADERYVHLDEYGTEFFRKNAEKYWQGVQGNDNANEEILFWGKAKIIDAVY